MKFKRSEFDSAAFEYLQERLAYQQRRGDKLQQLLLTDLKEAKGVSFMEQLKEALFDKYALEIQVQAVVDSKLKIIAAEKDLISRNFHRMVLLVQEYDRKIERLMNQNRPIEIQDCQTEQEMVEPETDLGSSEVKSVPVVEEIQEKAEIIDVQPEDFLLDFSPNQSESNKLVTNESESNESETIQNESVPSPMAIEDVECPPTETALVPVNCDSSSDDSEDSISLPEDLEHVAIEMPEETSQTVTPLPATETPSSVLEILDVSPDNDNQVEHETTNEPTDQDSMGHDDRDESTNINDTFDEIIEKSEEIPSYTICKSMSEIQDELLMAIDDRSTSPDAVLIQDPVVPEVPAIVDESADPELICDECGKLCASKKGLKIHKFKAHSKSSHKTPTTKKSGRPRSCDNSPPKSSEKTFKCDECDYVTNRSYLLIQHSRNHGKNFLSCKTCGSKFKYYVQLKKHKINCEQ